MAPTVEDRVCQQGRGAVGAGRECLLGNWIFF